MNPQPASQPGSPSQAQPRATGGLRRACAALILVSAGAGVGAGSGAGASDVLGDVLAWGLGGGAALAEEPRRGGADDPGVQGDPARREAGNWRDRKPAETAGRSSGQAGAAGGTAGGDAVAAPGAPHEPRGRPELPPELMRDALAVLRDLRPDLEGEVQRNPERFHLALRGLMSSPKARQLIQAHRHDPENYPALLGEAKALLEIQRVGEQFRAALSRRDSVQAESLRRKARQLVENQFEQRMKQRESEVGQLEKKLEHVRNQLREARQNRERLISSSLEGVLSGRRPEGEDQDSSGDSRGKFMKPPRADKPAPGTEPGEPGAPREGEPPRTPRERLEWWRDRKAPPPPPPPPPPEGHEAQPPR